MRNILFLLMLVYGSATFAFGNANHNDNASQPGWAVTRSEAKQIKAMFDSTFDDSKTWFRNGADGTTVYAEVDSTTYYFRITIDGQVNLSKDWGDLDEENEIESKLLNIRDKIEKIVNK
jgi:hypothetical protein